MPPGLALWYAKKKTAMRASVNTAYKCRETDSKYISLRTAVDMCPMPGEASGVRAFQRNEWSWWWTKGLIWTNLLYIRQTHVPCGPVERQLCGLSTAVNATNFSVRRWIEDSALNEFNVNATNSDVPSRRWVSMNLRHMLNCRYYVVQIFQVCSSSSRRLIGPLWSVGCAGCQSNGLICGHLKGTLSMKIVLLVICMYS